MDDKSKINEPKLSLIAHIIKTSFFEKSRLKNIAGSVVVIILLMGTYALGRKVAQDNTILSISALIFIFMCAITVISFQNFLMFSWLRELKPIQKETAEKKINEILEACKKRNQLFRKVSLSIFIAAFALEYNFKSKFQIHLDISTEHPIVWLIPAIIIFVHMIINTGRIVEMMRLGNVAGQEEELISAINNTKIYPHQIPELMEGFFSTRMLLGYAIGTCMVMYLIS